MAPSATRSYVVIRVNKHVNETYAGESVKAALDAASPLPRDTIEIAVVGAWNADAALLVAQHAAWAPWGSRS